MRHIFFRSEIVIYGLITLEIIENLVLSYDELIVSITRRFRSAIRYPVHQNKQAEGQQDTKDTKNTNTNTETTTRARTFY